MPADSCHPRALACATHRKGASSPSTRGAYHLALPAKHQPLPVQPRCQAKASAIAQPFCLPSLRTAVAKRPPHSLRWLRWPRRSLQGRLSCPACRQSAFSRTTFPTSWRSSISSKSTPSKQRQQSGSIDCSCNSCRSRAAGVLSSKLYISLCFSNDFNLPTLALMFYGDVISHVFYTRAHALGWEPREPRHRCF